MSAEAVGSTMPQHLTLHDLAAMAGADEHHRYELSPERVLFVMPPAGPEHALVVMRMVLWLAAAGFTAEQLAADLGVDTDGGARIPDLTVWAAGNPPERGRSSYATLAGMLLAVEVVSASSEMVDRVIKRDEYAKAGIPRYWIVDRDPANTVLMYDLAEAGSAYAEARTQPLSWLLGADPHQLLAADDRL